MDYINKIKTKLSQGQIVPVVGAGVSYATCEMPGWKGLIENGLKYAKDLGNPSDEILKATTFLAENKLIDAASIIKTLLNAPNHPFTNWLGDIFERPKIKSSKLIESIQNLCQPIIATTNYDDLLRTAGSPQTDMALDWSQHEEIQSYLSQHRRFILHLHGLYTRPHTPIFGADDYENLKKQIGYKTILNQLWMQKSFLFIGCSRDGVMDEDFMTVLKLMKDWFPGKQEEHYILMQDKEKGTKIHFELLQECNVHLVPFGKDHSELPNFINKLNPNAKEIVDRYKQQRNIAVEGIKSILEAQPKIELDTSVKDFIKENLGFDYYWLSDDKVSIFTEVLESYNLTIKEKQKKFTYLQTMMLALVDPSDLKRMIDLWPSDGQDTSMLNNFEFINMGILAWELLDKFPVEILDDINLRDPSAIHHYYFSGRLKQFYQEAKDWKESSGSLNNYEGDIYFFENLRRIMNSLLGVLELEVNEIYSEKSEAIIVKELPKGFVLTVSPKKLAIVNKENITETIAELPWDENLEFSDAMIIENEGKSIVVGYNAKYCFKWNPTEEITSSNFFNTHPSEYIKDLKISHQNSHVVMDIYTSKRRIIIVNFSESTEIKLEDRYGYYVKLASAKTYCTRSFGKIYKDGCVFEFSSLGEYKPKVTAVELWEMLKTIPEINADYASYFKEENLSLENEDFTYPYIEDVSLSKVNWLTGEILAIRIRFGFSGADSTALIFVDPTIGFDNPVLKIYFPHKNCFSFDTCLHDDNIDLMVGYLDYNEVGNLIQYFKNIEGKQLIVSGTQPGLIRQELLTRSTVRDMFYVNFVSKNRAFVIEEGKIVHDIDIPTLKSAAIAFADGINSITFYDSRI